MRYNTPATRQDTALKIAAYGLQAIPGVRSLTNKTRHTRKGKGEIMNRYIVLTEDKSCGHKHRLIDRAMECYNRLDRDHNVLLVTIPEENKDIDPLWIDKCLLKWTSMVEMAEVIEGV